MGYNEAEDMVVRSQLSFLLQALFFPFQTAIMDFSRLRGRVLICTKEAIAGFLFVCINAVELFYFSLNLVLRMCNFSVYIFSKSHLQL